MKKERDRIIIAEGRTMTHVDGDVYFDAENHLYAHVLKSGALLEVPGVSHIIRAGGAIHESRAPRRIMERAMDRGSAVHRACHLDVIGELDETGLREDVKPYLAAFRKWRADEKPVIVASEVPMYDPIHDIAGTADLILKNKYEDVCDIKSGPFQDWHLFQFAGYGIIRYSKDWLKHGLAGLYLTKRATYDYIPVPIHKQIAAGAEFLRMVKTCNEKRHSLFGGE
jgi:hypothetical protein